MRFGRLVTGERVVIRQGKVYDITGLIKPNPPDVFGEPVFGQLQQLSGEFERAINDPPVCLEEDAAFGSPVFCPTKVIGTPVNYYEHIAEAEADHEINLGRAIARSRRRACFSKPAVPSSGQGRGSSSGSRTAGRTTRSRSRWSSRT